MVMCLTGTQGQVIGANAQIDTNCGFPNANTYTWAIPQQAYNQDFWFISMPPLEGFKDGIGSWTQDQMMANVVNVSQEESQSNWWPPLPPSLQKPGFVSKIKSFFGK